MTIIAGINPKSRLDALREERDDLLERMIAHAKAAKAVG